VKKGFKYYAAVWAVVLVVFNVICFVTQKYFAGFLAKFGGAFWAGYAFITVAFIGQLVCAYMAFRTDSARKMFYNIPLITISYSGLVTMLIIGGACMAIPGLPNWVGAVVCFAVLAFCAISLIKAGAAADAVNSIDEKVKAKTEFIKIMTAKCEGIVTRAKSDDAKKECKKVYDAVRYADPMSTEELNMVETQIEQKIDEMKGAVIFDNTDEVKALADEIVILIGERNGMCKALK